MDSTNARTATSRLVVAAATLLSVLGSGCAPAIYAAHSGSASRAVERARLAHAADLAPYDYYYADACLHQARVDAGEAHYQDAIEYARAAREHAELALERSRNSMRETGR